MEKVHLEKSFFQKLKFKVKNTFIGISLILVSVAILWLLLQFVQWRYGFSIVSWFKSLPYVYPLVVNVYDEIARRTSKGILYLYGFGSMFLIPVPLEMMYLKLLKEGLNIEFLVPLIGIGLLIGHHFNYWVGRLFGFMLKYIISKKQRQKWSDYLKKYGGFVIIFFNALPLPSPLFNFMTGIFKYRYWKWFILFAIGQIINYTILTFVYIFFMK